ncbi:MAG: 2-C-methyl-D-erythritol 4-phosphate cytidylyltransferase [Gammaproteobacteria bacterium]
MNCWAVIPAAGAGRRMGAAVPKQYLRLGAKTVLEHSLDCLFADARVGAAVVALAADDSHWSSLQAPAGRRLLRAPGGAERCDSVLNALHVVAEHAGSDDWVLVHDAARPCLRAADLGRLIGELQDDPVGGLLAVPVRDTMKRSRSDGRVAATVERSHLWHALTPQMFRLGALTDALSVAKTRGLAVTDEASAMELAGAAPRLVEGHGDNIKITRAEDVALAEFFLRTQERL